MLSELRRTEQVSDAPQPHLRLTHDEESGGGSSTAPVTPLKVATSSSSSQVDSEQNVSLGGAALIAQCRSLLARGDLLQYVRTACGVLVAPLRAILAPSQLLCTRKVALFIK